MSTNDWFPLTAIQFRGYSIVISPGSATITNPERPWEGLAHYHNCAAAMDAIRQHTTNQQ